MLHLELFLPVLLYLSYKPTFFPLYLHYWYYTVHLVMPDRCARLKVVSGFFEVERGYRPRNSNRRQMGSTSSWEVLQQPGPIWREQEAKDTAEKERKIQGKALLIGLVIGRLEKQRRFSCLFLSFCSQTCRADKKRNAIYKCIYTKLLLLLLHSLLWKALLTCLILPTPPLPVFLLKAAGTDTSMIETQPNLSV